MHRTYRGALSSHSSRDLTNCQEKVPGTFSLVPFLDNRSSRRGLVSAGGTIEKSLHEVPRDPDGEAVGGSLTTEAAE
jgi:hypothetical protein